MTFMERALPNAFAAGRNTGLMLHNAELDNRLTWAAGIFEDADDFGDSFNDFSDYNVTARVTGLPWYEEEGRKLLHLGLSYSHRFRSEDNTDFRFRARPEAHITDARIVDTKEFAADDVDLINPELALVLGPFSLQGEYFYTSVDAADTDDPDFDGYYVYGSYFLTGEHRKYKASRGHFDRVKPKQNFHPTEDGWGAWEMGLRYSTIDLTDEDITGGEADNITVGLNWYRNPNVRVMCNYVNCDLEDRVGDEKDRDGNVIRIIDVDNDDVDIFQVRFQIDF